MLSQDFNKKAACRKSIDTVYFYVLNKFKSCKSHGLSVLWTDLLILTHFLMLIDHRWLLLCFHLHSFSWLHHACLFLLISTSYYLPVHLALRQSTDSIHQIRLLFKTTSMVEGSCSWNRSSVLIRFFRGLSFYNSTFLHTAVGWKGINRHHLSAPWAWGFLFFLTRLWNY